MKLHILAAGLTLLLVACNWAWAAPPATQKAPDTEAALDRVLPEVRFDNVPFNDVVDFLRDITGANLVVEWKKLEAAGVDKNSPVSLRLHNVKFRSILGLMLDGMSTDKAKVGFVVRDEAIVITVIETPATQPATRPAVRP